MNILVSRIAEIASRLLDNPNEQLSNNNELRFGKQGSLSVMIAGEKQGQWYDHENGNGGGPMELIVVKGGMNEIEAREWLRAQFNIVLRREIAATYDYCDDDGKLLFQVVRYRPKDFRQRRPDGRGGWIWNLKGVRPVPYRLPELLASTGRIYVVEGEKDADNLWKLGLTATTNPGGVSGKSKRGNTGKWRDEFTAYFRGRDVVIVPDNDEAGHAHVEVVAPRLATVARSLRVLALLGLGDKEDVSDWIAHGGTVEVLERLADQAPSYQADGAGTRSDNVAPSTEEPTSHAPSVSDKLLALTKDMTLFHTPDRTAFADVILNGHRETWAVKGRDFQRLLTKRFYDETRRPPTSEGLNQALRVIEAQAAFDSPQREIHVRVAAHGSRIYIDLADALWRVIEIDRNGWRLVEESPVRFRRAAGMLPLPVPTRGGVVDLLRQFLNLRGEEYFALVRAWLLQALRGCGPYPVLVLSGEQGSAKSTFCKILRYLIDPNVVPLRALPREDRDLFIAANNALVLCFDNVSGLPSWLSDSLCRLSTGGGFTVRALYTDGDEALFSAQRPTILNGIEEFVDRPDLGDRAIFLPLLQIPDESRKPEKDLWRDLQTQRPAILGALLDDLARGLRQLPVTRLDRPPRMADFAIFAKACEPGPEFGFETAYAANRGEAVANVIDADTVASALRQFMANQTEWRGNASELLRVLTPLVGDQNARSKKWPADGARLSGRLTRAATFLRKIGIEIERLSDGKRTIVVRCTEDRGNGASEASEGPRGGAAYRYDAADAGGAPPSGQRQKQKESVSAKAVNTQESGVVDGADAEIPTRSKVVVDL